MMINDDQPECKNQTRSNEGRLLEGSARDPGILVSSWTQNESLASKPGKLVLVIVVMLLVMVMLMLTWQDPGSSGKALRQQGGGADAPKSWLWAGRLNCFLFPLFWDTPLNFIYKGQSMPQVRHICNSSAQGYWQHVIFTLSACSGHIVRKHRLALFLNFNP